MNADAAMNYFNDGKITSTIELLLNKLLHKKKIRSVPIHNQNLIDEILRKFLNEIESWHTEQEPAEEETQPTTGKSATKASPATAKLIPIAKTEIIQVVHPAAIIISLVSLKIFLDGCILRRPAPKDPEPLISPNNHLAVYNRSLQFVSDNVKNKRTQIIITLCETNITISTLSGKCRCLREIFLFPRKAAHNLPAGEIMVHIQEYIEAFKRLLITKPFGNLQLVTERGAFGIMLEKPEQGLELCKQAFDQCDSKTKELLAIGLSLGNYEIFDENKMKYEPILGMQKAPEELANFYGDLLDKYPFVSMLIDPFRKEDVESWSKLFTKINPTREILIVNSSLMQPTGPGLIAPIGTGGSSSTKTAYVETVNVNNESEESVSAVNEFNDETGKLEEKKPTKITDLECPILGGCLPTRGCGPTGPRIAELLQVNEKQKEGEEEVTNAYMFAFEISVEALLITDLIRVTEKCLLRDKKSILSLNGNILSQNEWLLELGVGIGCDYVKIGGFQGREQANMINKWIELFRV
ncbi:enolase member 4 [Cichlidogyrus casuarinus]|uniref:phosphopyruvate hydratase n=1 Tax=Cichlidogyrus casuarinus TaxID=1844966 RepID=A0ABD2QF84_9PLAT